jgi:hypothetical protein
LPVAQSMNAVAPLPTRNCCSVCCIWLVQHLSSSLYDCAVCFVALRIRRCSQHSVAMVRQFVHWLLLHTPTTSLGLARTIYIRFIYGIFGRKITVYTVIYGAYIRFWPTVYISFHPNKHVLHRENAAPLTVAASYAKRTHTERTEGSLSYDAVHCTKFIVKANTTFTCVQKGRKTAFVWCFVCAKKTEDSLCIMHFVWRCNRFFVMANKTSTCVQKGQKTASVWCFVWCCT